MDLTSMLLRAGALRPHVLLVPAVGGTAVRLGVERELTRRGWPAADAPADTDLVVVAGRAGAELAGAVERIWAQVPAPRARIALSDPDPDVIAATLRNAAASLADPTRRRDSPDPGSVDTDGEGLERHRTANTLGSHHHHSEANTRDGEGDGAGGDMDMPGGLAMADLGADRDGLRLDRLHVSLGPVLPEWPAGLVVRMTLQGDVIQQAHAEVLDSATGGVSGGAVGRFWAGPGRAAARELDALARFLSVAGLPDAAARARQVRDDLLLTVPTAGATATVAALVRAVRRSRTLRWMVRDVGAPGGPRGELDVLARLEQRLDAVATAIADPDAPTPRRPQVGELAGLLAGTEFGAARLIVAVLDPDTEPDPATMPAAAGQPTSRDREDGTTSGSAHG